MPNEKSTDDVECEQQSTSSKSNCCNNNDDSDDSYEDLHRGPGAPYPPDTDSDEEEEIDLPEWMGPVKLEFPPKALVGAYQFFHYERCKQLNKQRKRDPDPGNFQWPDLMQEWVDMSKERKQPYVDEYRDMKQSFRDRWEEEKELGIDTDLDW